MYGDSDKEKSVDCSRAVSLSTDHSDSGTEAVHANSGTEVVNADRGTETVHAEVVFKSKPPKYYG